MIYDKAVKQQRHSSPFERIAFSRRLSMILLRWLVVVLLSVLAVVNFKLAIQSLAPVFLYRKDLLQEFLMSKAVFNGLDPYWPLPKLAVHFLPHLPTPILPHPTPHPPTVILFSAPFSLLSYENAILVWFILEIVWILGTAYLLARWAGGKRRVLSTLLIAILFLGWHPFLEELIYAQIMILLLILFTLAWQFLRRDKDVLGGVFLGLVIALKLIAWPVAIFLLLKRKWKAVMATGFSVVMTNVISGMIIGFDTFFSYYLNIVRSATTHYAAFAYNFSLWTVGQRLFKGTGSEILIGPTAPPLWYAPGFSEIFSVLLPVLFVIFGLFIAIQVKSFDVAVGILVVVSILVSPVTWIHYFTWLVIPIAVLGRQLFLSRFPTVLTSVTLFVFLLLRLSGHDLYELMGALAGFEPVIGVSLEISPVWGLLTYVPTLGALMLFGVLWFADRQSGLPRSLPGQDRVVLS